MSFAKDGFLADSLHNIRELISKNYADWRSLLGRINRLAVANQYLLVIHRDNDVERYAALLFARTLTTVQAGVILLETGLVPQARILLRSALETYYSLAALAKDPSFIDKLIEGQAAEQKRAAKNIKLWQHPALRRIADIESKPGGWQSIEASAAKPIKTNILDIAKKAGLEDSYRVAYMTLSQPVHGSATDLNRHVVLGENGEVREYQNDPEIEDQEITWIYALDILLGAMTALAIVFPNIDKVPIEQHDAETYTLIAKWDSSR